MGQSKRKPASKAKGRDKSVPAITHQFIMALRRRIDALEFNHNIIRIRCDHAVTANAKLTEDNRRLNLRVAELTTLIEKDSQGKLAFRRINRLESDLAPIIVARRKP